jgi:hypothetical protein
MEHQTVGKTYNLKSTTEQERMLGRTLMHCRRVSNATIGERREA